MSASTPTSTRSLDDPLAMLVGVDLAVGRASTDGNERLYRRLLEMFRTGQRDVVERFRAAWAVGDDMSAMRCAHNLRTVAASLGMTVLADVGKRLELACRELANDGNDAQVHALLAELAAALRPVLTGLDALHGSRR